MDASLNRKVRSQGKVCRELLKEDGRIIGHSAYINPFCWTVASDVKAMWSVAVRMNDVQPPCWMEPHRGKESVMIQVRRSSAPLDGEDEAPAGLSLSLSHGK